MDTRSLVDDDIELGKRVTELLSTDSELRVRAALWWFDENNQQWLYTISTPLVQKRGLQAAYLRVRGILEKAELLGKLPLDRVWVIDDRHPTLDILRRVFGHIIHGLRSIGNVVNGVLLPDMHIYKLERRKAGIRRAAD